MNATFFLTYVTTLELKKDGFQLINFFTSRLFFAMLTRRVPKKFNKNFSRANVNKKPCFSLKENSGLRFLFENFKNVKV